MATERFIIPDGDLDTDVTLIDTSTGIEYEDNFKDIVDLMNTLYDVEEDLLKENKDLREQLILANAFIKMIENCYEDASIEDILYMKYGEFQEELHLQMAIAKEEL